MGIRGSAKQRAAPLCTFSEADQSGLEKGRELLTEGGSRNEGGGKLPLVTPFKGWFFLDMEIDPDRDLYLSIYR